MKTLKLLVQWVGVFVLCAAAIGAHASVAANVPDPDRTGRENIRNVIKQALTIDGSLIYDAVALQAVSVVPVSAEIDRYTVSMEAGRTRFPIKGDYYLLGGDIKQTYERNVNTNEVRDVNDPENALLLKMNTLVTQIYGVRGARPNGRHQWAEVVRLTNNVSATVMFNMSTAESASAGPVHLIQYATKPITFTTRAGDKVVLTLKGVAVADMQWKHAYLAASSYEATVTLPDGSRKVARGSRLVNELSVYSGVPVLDSDDIPELKVMLDAEFQPLEVARSIGDSLQAPPAWVAEVEGMATTGNALSLVIAEERTNPFPLLAIVAAIVTMDSVVTNGYKLAMYAAGHPELADSYKGLVGSGAKAIGEQAATLSKYLGSDEQTAAVIGTLVEDGVGLLVGGYTKAAVSASSALARLDLASKLDKALIRADRVADKLDKAVDLAEAAAAAYNEYARVKGTATAGADFASPAALSDATLRAQLGAELAARTGDYRIDSALSAAGNLGLPLEMVAALLAGGGFNPNPGVVEIGRGNVAGIMLPPGSVVPPVQPGVIDPYVFNVYLGPSSVYTALPTFMTILDNNGSVLAANQVPGPAGNYNLASPFDSGVRYTVNDQVGPITVNFTSLVQPNLNIYINAGAPVGITDYRGDWALMYTQGGMAIRQQAGPEIGKVSVHFSLGAPGYVYTPNPVGTLTLTH